MESSAVNRSMIIFSDMKGSEKDQTQAFRVKDKNSRTHLHSHFSGFSFFLSFLDLGLGSPTLGLKIYFSHFFHLLFFVVVQHLPRQTQQQD